MAVRVQFATGTAAVCPTVWKTKSLLTARSSMKASEPGDMLCPSASSAVVAEDCTGMGGNWLEPVSLSPPVASPATDCCSSRPVSAFCDAASAASHDNTPADILDRSKTLTPHSTGHAVSNVGTSSDEVLITSCCQNSLLAPLVEPSFVRAAIPQQDTQDMPPSPHATAADGAFPFREMEVSKTFDMSSLQQVQCGLFDSVSGPSSPSESESEPLGGCKDALLNPDHCISDLCLEDDDDNVFGAAGFQSPPRGDSLDERNNSLATSPVLESPRHGLAVLVNNGIKEDISKLDAISFSDSHCLNTPCSTAFNETQRSSCCSISHTVISRFRSQPNSQVCDEISSYGYTSLVNSSSPFRSPPKSPVFRSPPKSPVSILEAKGMWNKTTAQVEDLQAAKMFVSPVMLPADDASCSDDDDDAVVTSPDRMVNCSNSHDVTCNVQLTEWAESSESPSGIAVPTTCEGKLLNSVIEKDLTVRAGNDADVFDYCSRPLVSHYKPDCASEPSVTAIQCGSAKPAVNEATCVPANGNVHCPTDEVRCQNGSLLDTSTCRDVDLKGRPTSVKQLKSKFEAQRDLESQVGTRSSLNFALALGPSSAECNELFKIHRDATHLASPYVKKLEDMPCSEVTGVISANTPSCSAAQCSHTENESECISPSSVQKSTRATVRDFRQCRQSSIAARISCFEPVMSASSSGCQKEKKRARLSSCGSSAVDPSEKLDSMSHSMKEPYTERHQSDASGWFVESPRRSRPKEYRGCSSAGCEDLLALLNIPATSANNIPRVSERKRIFEMELAVPKVKSSDSLSSVFCRSPEFEPGQQRMPTVDKENSFCRHNGNCRGQVNSRRSLFERTSACLERNDSVDSDSSADVDCHPFHYPVNEMKTKNRYLQTGHVS